MTGALALLAAASTLAGAPPTLERDHLPVLPQRGLVRDLRNGVELQTMRGRPLGVLRGLSPAPDAATSRDLLMRDGRGSLYVLDRRARRVRQISDGPPTRRPCRVTDRRAQVQLIVCKSTIRTRSAGGDVRVVVRAPRPIGHWERAAWSPRGTALFAQWSAECEVPIAFLVIKGKMRPFGGTTMNDAPSSMALGWLPNGSAVVHFPKAACGGSYHRAGIYAVPRRGQPTLLVRTPRFEYYWMWGG